MSPFAVWTLTQEARALLTRLSRVKPFALLEPMVPAAALLPPASAKQTRMARPSSMPNGGTRPAARPCWCTAITTSSHRIRCRNVVPAGVEIVHEVRQQFLAGATLSLQQHGRVRKAPGFRHIA